MIIKKLTDMKHGWFVGAFEPTAFYTKDFEVNYRTHPAGSDWDMHYHTDVTEINLLIRGRMTMQGQELVTGDIFIIEPWEVTDPVFIEDCEIICVKTPSKNDKQIIKKDNK
jgi:mannose-6-phosphate isomerase-like protein (cupin superfamily)